MNLLFFDSNTQGEIHMFLSTMTKRHVIDTGSEPMAPIGFKILHHQKGGLIEINPETIEQILKGGILVNLTLMNYLLENKILPTPPHWKKGWSRLIISNTILEDEKVRGLRKMPCLVLSRNTKIWKMDFMVTNMCI